MAGGSEATSGASSTLPVGTSQILIDLSLLPEASRLLSGLNANGPTSSVLLYTGLAVLLLVLAYLMRVLKAAWRHPPLPLRVLLGS